MNFKGATPVKVPFHQHLGRCQVVQAKVCTEIEDDKEVEVGMEMTADKKVVQMRALHGEAKDEHHEDKTTLTATILSAIDEIETEEKGEKDNNLKANTAISKLAEIFLEAKNLPPEETMEIIIALAREETRQMQAVIELWDERGLEQESPHNRDNLLESTAEILQDPPTQAGTGAVAIERLEADSEIDAREEIVSMEAVLALVSVWIHHPQKSTSTTEPMKGLVQQSEQKTILTLQAGRGLPILENLGQNLLDPLDSPIYEMKHPKWKVELKSPEHKDLHGIIQHRNEKNEKKCRKNEKKKRK